MTLAKGVQPPELSRYQAGQFIKGCPQGPRALRYKDIEQLAREHCPEAIEALAEIVNDDTAIPGARIAAATVLLDRGFGKPRQTVDATINVSLAEEHLVALNALTDLASKAPVIDQEAIDTVDVGGALVPVPGLVAPDPFGEDASPE